MSQLIIVTTPQNSGEGTPLATAFNYTNTNFTELYARAQTVPPATLYGQPTDQAGMYAYSSSYFYYCFANYTTGNNVIWAQVTQVGNLSVASIENGSSNVSIPGANANVIIGINGTSNVATFSTTGAYVHGVVSATGNVSGSYILGNGSQLTGLPATYTNSNVTSLLSNFGSNVIVSTANITGGNLISGGLISAGGNINGSNVNASGNVISQGVVSAVGNIVTTGYFVGTFVGNVTGNFVIPGSNTQVIFNTNGNADAAAGMTYNRGSNTFTVLGIVSSQGNVIAGNVTTAGQVIATSNITGGNVLTGGIVSSAGNITGSNLYTAGVVSATGNVRGGNVNTDGLVTVAGNITGGNINTAGQISATGNITGFHLTIGNADAGGNVSATNYTGTNVSVIGNITGGNITGANVLTGGQVSATGNVTGNYILGNLTYANGLPTQYSNSNVTTLLAGFGSNTISTTGNITAGNFYTIGNVTGAILNATGNLNVNGNVNGTLTSTVILNNTTRATGANTGVLQVAGGVSFGQDLYVTGNIFAANITGTQANIITVTDPLLYLESSNAYPYNYDIGFYSHFVGGTGNTYQHTGLVRDFNDNTWKLFSNVAEPSGGIVTFNANTIYDSFLSGSISSTGIISAAGNITGGNITGANLSVGTGTVTAGNIVNANGNLVGNIGSSSNYFNTVFAKATSAQYADLAEKYESDSEYITGTVVVFGGTKEITVTTERGDERVAGVISENPAHLMNADCDGQAVALRGRVPVRVIGPVVKGDSLITSTTAGVAVSVGRDRSYAQAVFAKAIETDLENGEKTIIAVIL